MYMVKLDCLFICNRSGAPSGTGLCAVRAGYARSDLVMRGEINLYALTAFYARTERDMRAQTLLCAVK